jgi:hypothetical protein
LGRRNSSKDVLNALIVPQIKQLGAAIVADVADPARHQSAVGKWRLGSSPDTKNRRSNAWALAGA